MLQMAAYEGQSAALEISTLAIIVDGQVVGDASAPILTVLLKTISILEQLSSFSSGDDDEVDDAIYTCLHVCYSIAVKCPVRELLIRTTALIPAVVRVACMSASARVISVAVSLLYLFAYFPAVGKPLLQTGLVVRLVEVTSSTLVQAAGATDGRNERVGIVVDVLSFLLYQARLGRSLLSRQSSGSVSEGNTEEWPVAAMETSVVMNEDLWIAMQQFLSRPNTSACAAAARLLHVLACSDDLTVVAKLWFCIERWALAQSLINLACDGSTSDNDAEAALLAIVSVNFVAALCHQQP